MPEMVRIFFYFFFIYLLFIKKMFISLLKINNQSLKN